MMGLPTQRTRITASNRIFILSSPIIILMLIKVVAALVVLVEIGFFGYLPYIWTNFGQNRRVMSIVGCFASGLFLALAFLHILPEANEELEHAYRKWFAIKPSKKGHQLQQFPWGSLIMILTFVGVLTIESLVHRYLEEKDAIHKKNSKEESEQVDRPRKGNNTSAVILTQLALSLHAFIECMALGSQTTTKATMTLLIGIGCHKWAEGLTLGFEYKKAGFSSATAIKFCLFHAILNSGAVLLGWLLSSASEFLSGVLGAVSAGTFLYVSTIEKAQEEFSSSERVGLEDPVDASGHRLRLLDRVTE